MQMSFTVPACVPGLSPTSVGAAGRRPLYRRIASYGDQLARITRLRFVTSVKRGRILKPPGSARAALGPHPRTRGKPAYAREGVCPFRGEPRSRGTWCGDVRPENASQLSRRSAVVLELRSVPA